MPGHLSSDVTNGAGPFTKVLLQWRMRARATLTLIVVAALPIAAQSPKVHRLEATPSTVAYGYYWSEAKPVLRIASGDILDVDTLLTSTPDRLEKSGVPATEIQASLRAIVEQVKDRGPGGHILTGPVYVEGAEPGDALEVQGAVDRSADRLRLQRLQRVHPRELRRPGAGRRSSAWIASA